MKNIMRYFLLLSLSATSAFAEGKFSGLMFGDLYWFAKHNNETTKTATDLGYQGQHGFWIRRVYFTYDYKIDEQLSTRFRLETSSSDFATKIDPKKNSGEEYVASTMTPFVKDAYLAWKWGGPTFYFGLIGAPTFELAEGHWGLRPVEKSPEDLWGFGSSRDLGIGLKGNFGDGLLGYNLVFGNGSGTNHEVNKGKKIYLSLTTAPIKEMILEGYADYESNTNNYTTHLFGGYKAESFRFGGQYARTVQSKKGYNMLSLYGVTNLVEKWSAFARIDALMHKGLGDKIYLRTSKSAKPTLYIVGVDYEIAKNAHLMPNLEYVKYDTADVNSDLIPRLTFSWVF